MADPQAAVQALLDELVESGAERGLQAAAYLDGRMVVDAWAGVADPATGRAVDGDTLFTVFSCSKGITATVIHLLAERGKLQYDDPIAKHWPEFAAHGKERITIRHALTHTAGLPKTPEGDPNKPPGAQMADWGAMCRAIADLTPLWEPGTQTGYHALTFGWLLGEVARRADGRPIERIVAEDICAPLGIEAFFFGIPESAEARVAPLENDATMDEGPAATPESRAIPHLFNRPDIRRAVIPAGGGIANARSLARHYAGLIGDGVDGVRLLPPERVRIATTVQTEAVDTILGRPIRKGLGYFLGREESAMSERATAFGHPGHGGSIGFADPEYRFAFALTKNRLVSSAPGQGTVNEVSRAARAALGIPEA
jgi:CubicO group peptidase (beta-lactamase class C family)